MHGIEYKLVNCYKNNVIEEINGCDGLMWHFNHASSKDVLFAKQLLYSAECAGKKVFPNFNTAWHFDDKLGQKYLLEAVNAPMVPSYTFFDKKEALNWVNQSKFPKVFKLRKGAGAANVKKVQSKTEAIKIINKAFNRGFSTYNKWGSIKERVYKYRQGKSGLWNVAKGFLRLGKTTRFSRVSGREAGYVYFQDFIPGNDHDIRIIVIDGKAFGIKRMVRKGDFRASGSGHVLYGKEHFDTETVRLSLNLADEIESQCLAIDYVYHKGKPMIVEISYGFIKEVYYQCEGYWDRNLEWHPGEFDAQGWMVDALVNEIRAEKTNSS